MLSRSEKYVCFSASETFHFTCGRMVFEVSYYRGKKPEGCPKHISSLDFLVFRGRLQQEELFFLSSILILCRYSSILILRMFNL